MTNVVNYPGLNETKIRLLKRSGSEEIYEIKSKTRETFVFSKLCDRSND